MPEIIMPGTWVEIEKTILTPAQRAPQVPEDTRKTPYMMRVSGFLQDDAAMGAEVTIRTLTGRVLTGTLKVVNPSYHHGFGHTVPELLTIGTGGRT